LPARDMGWPYFARFSGVSATGPLVTMVVVTLAPWPKLVAEVAVAPVEAVVSVDTVVSVEVVEDVTPVSVDVSVEVEDVALVSLVGVDGLVVVDWSGVADEVDWAMAAPAIRAEAAAAVARILRVIGLELLLPGRSDAPPRCWQKLYR
jgi:hypothetical protein